MEEKNVQGILKLNKLVFDKIEFRRLGFNSDKAFKMELQSSISKRDDSELYKVSLILTGVKSDEYSLEISLSGFFSIEDTAELEEKLRNDLITKNSVAILMPYLRSELSLLTAQPEMECIVLPTFNINNMLKNVE